MRRLATLATLVLGPRAPGAAWEVRGSAALPSLEAAHQLRLAEILASLAGWAEAAEPPMMALLPLGDGSAPALLLKADRLHGANAVLLTPDAMAEAGGRPEWLLSLLPAPDGSLAFARAVLALPPLATDIPLKPDWTDIGIAWRDIALMVPESADVIPALATVLQRMAPPEQALRITGWATTAMMPAAGDFDPWERCQLLILGPGRRLPNGLRHQVVRLDRAGLPATTVSPPLAWEAWTLLRQAVGADVPAWQFEMAAEFPPVLLADLAETLASRGWPRPRLLAALRGVSERHALALLAAWLAADGAAGVDPAEIDSLPIEHLIDGLDMLPAPGRALEHLPLAVVGKLADQLVARHAATGPLASDLAVALARSQPDHQALQLLVLGRLNALPGPDISRLARADVVEALGPRRVDLALKLTASALPSPTATVAAFGTALATVRLANVAALTIL